MQRWVIVCYLIASSCFANQPPFDGTCYVSKDIITDSDPSAFDRLEPKRQKFHKMFDRRVDGWIYDKAFLFTAFYSDGLQIEMQVNSEFESTRAAQEVAQAYAIEFGRLPKCLREDVQTAWIHKGNEPFGGGNNNLLVHVGETDDIKRRGVLEEILFHEAVHTSLDASYASHRKWIAAQKSDAHFISKYAQDNPEREDLAETFLLWFAARHRPERLSTEQLQKIETSIPARLRFLDSLNLDLSPAVPWRLSPQDEEVD
jgi:hypothetical protein